MKSDIYSLAVLFAILYEGKEVPVPVEQNDRSDRWPAGVPRCSNAPPEFRALLERMFEKHTTQRPSALEVQETFGPVFSDSSHTDKSIVVEHGKVEVDGVSLTVKWFGSFADGPKKITSVDNRHGGKVLLDDQTAFENPGKWVPFLWASCFDAAFNNSIPIILTNQQEQARLEAEAAKQARLDDEAARQAQLQVRGFRPFS